MRSFPQIYFRIQPYNPLRIGYSQFEAHYRLPRGSSTMHGIQSKVGWIPTQFEQAIWIDIDRPCWNNWVDF